MTAKIARRNGETFAPLRCMCRQFMKNQTSWYIVSVSVDMTMSLFFEHGKNGGIAGAIGATSSTAAFGGA